MTSTILDKKNTRVNFLANILLILGFLFAIFGGYLIYQRYNPQKLSFDIKYDSVLKPLNYSGAIPVAISIQSQKIELPIIPSEIRNNKWEATTKGVSYLKGSALPGEKGNSILYGHNWPNLLGNLSKVKPGDKITINFQDNSSKDFLVEYTAKVKPDQTSVLESSLDNRITLYTCSGFLDSLRLVVVAKLLV